MTKKPAKQLRTLKLSPLALESVHIIDFEYREIETDGKQKKPANALDFSQTIDEKTMACSVIIDLTTVHEMRDERVCVLHVKAEGRFGFHQDAPDDLRKKLLPLHPAVNLLGFLRGMIFQMTSSLPGGPFLIPLLDLTGVFDRSDLWKPAVNTENITPAATKTVRKKASAAD